jgi:hypothetical protein
LASFSVPPQRIGVLLFCRSENQRVIHPAQPSYGHDLALVPKVTPAFGPRRIRPIVAAPR